MLVHIYDNKNGDVVMNTYYSFDEYYNDTFSMKPGEDYFSDILFDTDRFTCRYKDYGSRQNLLRLQAQYYQSANIFTLYWSEVAELGNYFERYGRRYGLIKEFRENGII